MFTRVPRVHLFIRVCAAFQRSVSLRSLRCLARLRAIMTTDDDDERIVHSVHIYNGVPCFLHALTCDNDVPFAHVHIHFNRVAPGSLLAQCSFAYRYVCVVCTRTTDLLSFVHVTTTVTCVQIIFPFSTIIY